MIKIHVFLLWLGIFSHASANAVITYPLLPENISKQTQLRGIATVHQEIFNDPLAVNMFLLAVDSGHTDWLHIADKFLLLENPTSHDRLLMAIGEALQWAPENVFDFDSFPLEKICSLDGMYEWRRFSRFLATTAIKRRTQKLYALDNRKYSTKKSTCLQTLENAHKKNQTDMNDFVSE